MLAYLDALLTAIALRDHAAIQQLLSHPLARILPAEARAEADSFATGDRDPLAAPLRVMQLRHQTSELLRDAPVVADRDEEASATRNALASRVPGPALTRRPARLAQMELPLSA